MGVATALCTPAAEAPAPLISTFSSHDIGADAASFWIRQGPEGVIFVGANTLLTFDGSRWNSTPADSAYALRRLDFESDHRLWVAASGDLGWFERSRNLRWEFHSLRAHLPEAQRLGPLLYVIAHDGGATFAAEEHLLRWDGAAFQKWSLPDARRLPTMRVGTTVFVHHHGEGLLELGAAGPRMFIPQDLLGDAAVLWMAAWSGDLLLATSKGLMLYQRGTVRPFAPEVSRILVRDSFTSAAMLFDGRYAFGTFGGGIVLMKPDGGLDRVLSEREGLPTRAINALAVDREGALWGASPTHIFRIELNSPTTIFDLRAGLPEQAYRSLARSGDRIVTGTATGLFELRDGTNTFVASTAIDEYVHDVRATDGGFLVGQRRGARLVVGGDSVAVHTTKSDVFAITPSRRTPNRLYLADNRSIVATAVGAEPRTVVNQMPDIARSIAEDDEGNLWLATIGNGVLLGRLEDRDAVEAISVPSSYGLPALSGRSFVRATPNGSILIFASNGGWIKPAGQGRFTAIANYPRRAVIAVSDFDDQGTGWIVHPGSEKLAAGVARISSQDGGALWEPHAVNYLPMIGAPRSIFVDPAAAKPTLWIGGTRFVLRHVVERGLAAPAPRAPLLRAFARTSPDKPLELITAPLPYSTRAIEFELAAPEYSRLGSLRLETFIDGLDDDWITAGTDARRELSGIRDGNYTLQTRAVAETGVASPPVAFAFKVMPPWWRTTPVLAMAAIALLPVGYVSYRWRIRTLRRRTAELEKKVRQRTEELEAASAAKTQFVANMSHDIRNPLNGIVGMALALEDTRLDRNQREMVATLRECTTYLSSLVDDVLDFASIEAGRVELRPGPFMPPELLRSIVATLRGDTAERGALLTVESDPNVPANLLGDAGRIQQILVNFVSNALKYAGGSIRLAVQVPPGAPDEVEFSVTDAGPGISDEEQATLFTKFSRLDRSRRDNIPGSGLGLAACRLLADLMGGSVGVESRPGQGAKFFLRLPLMAATPAVQVEGPPLPNTTVLVVEDTDYNAAAASAVLAKLGLTSERARTGAEALQLFQQRRFNIVLLDRNLPDMDGTEVARRIRGMESENGLSAMLLAVTAYCTAEDRALCLESGMDAFVGKPLTPDKLRKALLTTGRQLVATPPVEVSPEAPTSNEIDVSLFSYLSDGSPSGIETQIERHIAAVNEALARLRDAALAADFRALRTAAHDLGGYAQMVGAAALADLAAQLRGAAQPERAAQCIALIQRTEAEIRALTEAMRHHRPASQPA